MSSIHRDGRIQPALWACSAFALLAAIAATAMPAWAKPTTEADAIKTPIAA